MVTNYLPHIIRDVVSEVSKEMYDKHGFEVFFEYGLYQNVSKSLSERMDNKEESFPLIYMIMPYDEDAGSDPNIAYEADVSFLVCTPTETGYQMWEREENNYFPILFPIYEAFLKRLSLSRKLENTRADMIRHTKTILPYWGGDETGNNNSPNIAKHYVDALKMSRTKLVVNNNTYC